MDWRPLFSKIWVSDGVGFIVRCGKVSVSCGGGGEGGMTWGGGGVCRESRVCGDVRIETLAMREEGNGNPDQYDRLIMKISQRSATQRTLMVV